jgi:hypothetical protein
MKNQFGTSIYLWTFLVSHTVCNFTTNNVELEKDTNIRLIKYYGSEMATSALHWKPSDVIAVIYIFVDFVISKNIFNCDKNSIKSVWIAHRLGSSHPPFIRHIFRTTIGSSQFNFVITTTSKWWGRALSMKVTTIHKNFFVFFWTGSSWWP